MVETSIIIAIIGFGSALLGYITRLFFYSKCSDVSFCCFKCHRNTEQEQKNVSQMNIDIGKAISEI